ncbi:MAG: SMC family ATPase [Methanobacteriota archaeon]
MRLEGLSLSNWACHPELEVDLSRGLQIEGRNGTGKSSILRAIRFAFAGTAAGYKNRMIKNGERQAEITLSFTRDGKKYSINKVLHKDKPSTAQLTCEGELVADNPKNVSEALKDFLSEEVLDNLNYVPQGEITWIVDRLTQKGGRQELDSLFGLNRLEKAYKACGEKIREVKVKTEVFEEQLAKYPEDAEKGFWEGLEGLSEEGGRLGIQIAEKNKVLSEVSGNLSEVEKNISELKKRKVQREKSEVELGRLEIAISDVSNRIASFQREFNSLEGEKKELAELKSQASQCEKYAGLRKLLTEFTSLNDKLAQTKADEGESSRLRELELAVSGRDEAGKTLIEFEKQFEKFNAALIESELEVQKLRAFLKDLRGLSGQTKCPRCGQALSKGHLMDETVVTEQTIVKEEDRVGNIKSKEPEVRTFLDEAKARVKELQKMEFELKSLKDAIEKREGERVKVLKEREEISVKLKERGYDGEDPSLVEMKVSEYNNLKGKIEVVEEKVSGEGELKEKIEKLTKDNEANLVKKKELSKAWKKLYSNPRNSMRVRSGGTSF